LRNPRMVRGLLCWPSDVFQLSANGGSLYAAARPSDFRFPARRTGVCLKTRQFRTTGRLAKRLTVPAPRRARTKMILEHFPLFFRSADFPKGLPARFWSSPKFTAFQFADVFRECQPYFCGSEVPCARYRRDGDDLLGNCRPPFRILFLLKSEPKTRHVFVAPGSEDSCLLRSPLRSLAPRCHRPRCCNHWLLASLAVPLSSAVHYAVKTSGEPRVMKLCTNPLSAPHSRPP